MKTNQIALLVIAAIIVIACVGVYTMSDKSKDDSNNVNAVIDSDYYPVTVTTTIGGTEYQQTFTKKPERIVTVWPSSLELVQYFGLEDRVVGAFASEDYIVLNEDLRDDFDAFPKLPENTMSTEVVRSLDPDIIIGWSSTFGDSSWGIGNVASWNNYGINCFATNRPAESVSDYLKLLENMGIIFNMQDVSEKKIAEWNSRLETILEKTSNINESEKVTALVIKTGSVDSGTYHVYGSSFLTGDLVTQAGGINLFNGSMESLTIEKIVSYDPDIIFIMADDASLNLGNGLEDPDRAIEAFKSNPAFASMTDNIVAFRFHELYMGGILSDTILDRMFEAMYPDLT
jgi:ABC-type Fe3+-hydroxamate transport system, periplasmic component